MQIYKRPIRFFIMQRVLFLHHVSSVGGGSYCLLNLLKELDRTVFEPLVLLPGEGSLCEEIARLGIRVDFFPGMTAYPYCETLASYRSLRRLARLLRSFSGFSGYLKEWAPDIVYFNTLMLFPYLRTARRAGCKTVLHVREHWPPDAHVLQLAGIRRAVYRYADQLVAINRFSASLFPRKEAVTVYDWIDLEARKGPGIEELTGDACRGCTVYLYLGGMVPIKGAREVLRTFSEVIRGEDRRLLALGIVPPADPVPPSGIRAWLLSRKKGKRYEDAVLDLCARDQRIICLPAFYDLAAILRQADGYVSFFTIPHANLALAECILSGTPAVAARTDESLEYSDDGRLGLLYEQGNLEEFQTAWEKLDKDPALLDERLQAGAGKVSLLFDRERNAAVFNRMLKGVAGILD